MELVLLEEQQRRFFDDNGYLVVPGALMEQEVAQLTTVCDRMIDEFGRGADQYYVQRRPGIVQEKAFHPLLTHSSTVPLVVQLLSPNIHLHTTAIIYKFPQDDSGEGTRGWHRDIGMTEDLGHEGIVRAGIKVGYCLTDFSRAAVRFHYVRFPARICCRRRCPSPRARSIQRGQWICVLNAGDAFLFGRPRLPHRGTQCKPAHIKENVI